MSTAVPLWDEIDEDLEPWQRAEEFSAETVEDPLGTEMLAQAPPESVSPGMMDWADESSKPVAPGITTRREVGPGVHKRQGNITSEGEFGLQLEKHKLAFDREQYSWEKRKHRGKTRLPFVGGGVTAMDLYGAYKAIVRHNTGVYWTDDAESIGKYLSDVDRYESLGTWEKGAEVILEVPAFMVEIAATGGAVTVGRKAMVKVLKEFAKKRLKKFAKKKGAKLIGKAALKLGEVAGGAAGVAVMTAKNPGMIARQTSELLVREALKGDEADFGKAMWQGPLAAYLELGSEMTGGIVLKGVGRITGLSKLMEGVTHAWLKKYPGARLSQFIAKKNQVGWHGILGEFEEERLIEVGRKWSGIDEDYGLLQNLLSKDPKVRAAAKEQLQVEMIAFGFFGAAFGLPHVYGGLRGRGQTGMAAIDKFLERDPSRPKFRQDYNNLPETLRQVLPKEGEKIRLEGKTEEEDFDLGKKEHREQIQDQIQGFRDKWNSMAEGMDQGTQDEMLERRDRILAMIEDHPEIADPTNADLYNDLQFKSAIELAQGGRTLEALKTYEESFLHQIENARREAAGEEPLPPPEPETTVSLVPDVLGEEEAAAQPAATPEPTVAEEAPVVEEPAPDTSVAEAQSQVEVLTTQRDLLNEQREKAEEEGDKAEVEALDEAITAKQAEIVAAESDLAAASAAVPKGKKGKKGKTGKQIAEEVFVPPPSKAEFDNMSPEEQQRVREEVVANRERVEGYDLQPGDEVLVNISGKFLIAEVVGISGTGQVQFKSDKRDAESATIDASLIFDVNDPAVVELVKKIRRFESGERAKPAVEPVPAEAPAAAEPEITRQEAQEVLEQASVFVEEAQQELEKLQRDLETIEGWIAEHPVGTEKITRQEANEMLEQARGYVKDAKGKLDGRTKDVETAKGYIERHHEEAPAAAEPATYGVTPLGRLREEERVANEKVEETRDALETLEHRVKVAIKKHAKNPDSEEVAYIKEKGIEHFVEESNRLLGSAREAVVAAEAEAAKIQEEIEALPAPAPSVLLFQPIVTPTGRFVFVGNVPSVLSWEREDGKPISKKDMGKLKDSNIPAATAKSLGIKSRSWKSEDEAWSAAEAEIKGLKRPKDKAAEDGMEILSTPEEANRLGARLRAGGAQDIKATEVEGGTMVTWRSADAPPAKEMYTRAQLKAMKRPELKPIWVDEFEIGTKTQFTKRKKAQVINDILTAQDPPAAVGQTAEALVAAYDAAQKRFDAGETVDVDLPAKRVRYDERAALTKKKGKKDPSALDLIPPELVILGNEDTIVLAGRAEPLPITYAAVPIERVIGSHNYSAGWLGEEPRFEEGLKIQPRGYVKNSDEDNLVIERAELKNPDFFFKSASAIDGGPLMTPEGFILGGNSRLFMLQYSHGKGVLDEWYTPAFMEEAPALGIDTSLFDDETTYILVRMVQVDPRSDEADLIGRQTNDSLKVAQDPMRTANSLRGAIDQRLIAEMDIGEDETFSDAVTSNLPAAKRFRELLEKSLSPASRPQYFRPKDGMLTPEGRTLVRNMMLLSILPIETVEALNVPGLKSLLNTVEAAVPALLTLRNQYPSADISAALNEAVLLIERNPKKTTKMGLLDDLIRQSGLFDQGGVEQPTLAARMILDFLVRQREQRDGWSFPGIFNRAVRGIVEKVGGQASFIEESGSDVLFPVEIPENWAPIQPDVLIHEALNDPSLYVGRKVGEKGKEKVIEQGIEHRMGAEFGSVELDLVEPVKEPMTIEDPPVVEVETGELKESPAVEAAEERDEDFLEQMSDEIAEYFDGAGPNAAVKKYLRDAFDSPQLFSEEGDEIDMYSDVEFVLADLNPEGALILSQKIAELDPERASGIRGVLSKSQRDVDSEEGRTEVEEISDEETEQRAVRLRSVMDRLVVLYDTDQELSQEARSLEIWQIVLGMDETAAERAYELEEGEGAEPIAESVEWPAAEALANREVLERAWAFDHPEAIAIAAGLDLENEGSGKIIESEDGGRRWESPLLSISRAAEILTEVRDGPLSGILRAQMPNELIDEMRDEARVVIEDAEEAEELDDERDGIDYEESWDRPDEAMDEDHRAVTTQWGTPMSARKKKRKVRPTAAWHIIRRISQIPKLFGYRGARGFPLLTGENIPAKGKTYVFPMVIKIREAHDFRTAAWELGRALEIILYGTPRGGPWTGPLIERGMQNELLEMAEPAEVRKVKKAPKGGWKRQGFAKFMMFYLTDRNAAKKGAPGFYKWFTEMIERQHPAGARALDEVHQMSLDYGEQGVEQWAKDNVIDSGSFGERWESFKNEARLAPGKTLRSWWDALQPLHLFDKEYEAVTGKKPAEGKNIYNMAQGYRLAHSGIVNYMVNDSMRDWEGNDTSAPALNEISDHLDLEDYYDFGIYLWARRARALLLDEQINPRTGNLEPSPRNPGMTESQAKEIISIMDKRHGEKFGIAAKLYHDWNKGVLDYMGGSNDFMRMLVEDIERRDPGDYAPLARVFREIDVLVSESSSPTASGGEIIKRLRGSAMEQIRDPFQQAITNAEAIVFATHNYNVLQTMIDIATTTPGMGSVMFLEERKKVPAVSRTVESLLNTIEKELKSGGISVTYENAQGSQVKPEDMDNLQRAVMFFTGAVKPKDGDPMIPAMVREEVRQEDGSMKEVRKLKWYRVPDPIYRALAGMNPGQIKWIQRSIYANALFQTLFRGPARLFRLGTVGMRASFGLITNPMRDLQTLYINTQSQQNGFIIFGHYMASGVSTFLDALTGGRKTSPWIKLFERLGGQMSLQLMEDSNYTRRSARQAFMGKNIGRRIVRFAPWRWNGTTTVAAKDQVVTFFDWFKDVIQFPESAARITEMKLLAKEAGWKPGDRMTHELSLKLLLASKQVTVDFTAAGELARGYNQVIPFFNATIQGWRAFGRAVGGRGKKQLRAQVAARGLQLAGLALLNWWRNKDEDWWLKMDDTRKWMFYHIPMTINGEEVLVQIPMAYESGQLFGGLLVALLDSAYQDPGQKEAVLEWCKVYFESGMPIDIPVEGGVSGMELAPTNGLGVLPKAIMELGLNKKSFWGTPIVSPRFTAGAGGERVAREHQYNEYTTSAAKSLGKVLNLSPQQIDHAVGSIAGPMAMDLLRGSETLEDLFKLKKLKTVSDIPIAGRLFRRGGPLGSRPKPIDYLYDESNRAVIRGNDPTRMETEAQKDERLKLKDATRAITLMFYIRAMEEGDSKRRAITKEAGDLAQDVVDDLAIGRMKRDKYRLAVVGNEVELLKQKIWSAQDAGNRDQAKQLRKKLTKMRRSARKTLRGTGRTKFNPKRETFSAYRERDRDQRYQRRRAREVLGQ